MKGGSSTSSRYRVKSRCLLINTDPNPDKTGEMNRSFVFVFLPSFINVLGGLCKNRRSQIRENNKDVICNAIKYACFCVLSGPW